MFLFYVLLVAGKPAIGGTWSLIDMDGRLVTEKTYQGKFTLLYFGFARCPDICPSEMVKVGSIMDKLHAGKFFSLFHKKPTHLNIRIQISFL